MIKKSKKIKEYNINQRLQEKIKILLKKSGSQTLSEDEREWVSNTLDIISLSEKARSEKKVINTWSAIALLVIIVLVSLLMIIRVGHIPFIKPISTNHFSLSAHVNSLYLKLEKNEDLNILSDVGDIYCSYFEFNFLDEMRFTNLHLFHSDTVNKSDLYVEGDTIVVIELKVDEGASLKICKNEALSQIEVLGANSSGYLTLNKGHVKASMLLDTTISETEYPEFIYFKQHSKPYFPSLITIGSNNDFNLLNGKTINDLKFFNEYVQDITDIRYKSSIEDGRIILHSIEKEIKLRTNDELIFKDLKGFITDLSITAESIHIEFTGQARSIGYGPKNLVKNQAPTLLTFIINNQPLILMWGSIVFLWSLVKEFRKK